MIDRGRSRRTFASAGRGSISWSCCKLCRFQIAPRTTPMASSLAQHLLILSSPNASLLLLLLLLLLPLCHSVVPESFHRLTYIPLSFSFSFSLSHTRRHFPWFPRMAPATKIGASPRLRLTRYYLQRTYVTFRTAYYCDYRRIMRRPSVLQFIIELL